MYTIDEKLEQHKLIWLTKENHQYLREEKRKLKKLGINMSMAKMLNNLIKEQYEKNKI